MKSKFAYTHTQANKYANELREDGFKGVKIVQRNNPYSKFEGYDVFYLSK